MRFAAYVILMICIASVFYLMGLDTPLVSLYDAQDGQFIKLNCPPGDEDACDDTFLKMLAVTISLGVLGFVVLLISGQAAMFVIPIMLVFVILNFFVFPFSTIFEAAAMPGEVAALLVVFLNGLTVLALMSFIRGGV